MNKNYCSDLLGMLETVKVNLDEDINALSLLQDQFFIYRQPNVNLNEIYLELQIIISTLLKSMMLNQKILEDKINEYYE